MSDIAVNNSSELQGKYLTFYVDSQLYGIPITDVVQIVGIQEMTSVPDYPHYAKGIINLRGNIIPVIDIRLHMGKPEIAYDDRTCTIITNINGNFFGFIVEQVDEVLDVQPDEIAPPPKTAGTGMKLLTGIIRLELPNGEEKVILALEGAKLLGESEMNSLLCQVG